MNRNRQQPNRAKPTGFGFADAMFNIKDITAEYEDIHTEAKVENPFPQPEVPVKKTIPPKQPNKVTMVKKEPIQARQQPIKPEPRQPNVFKVSTGKEYDGLNSKPLIPIQASPHAY